MSKNLWAMINKRIFIPPALLVVIAVFMGLFNSEAFGKGASFD